MRRILLLFLTLSAAGVAVLATAGEVLPVFQFYRVSDHIHGYLLFREGLIRFYWYRCPDPVWFDIDDDLRRVVVHRVSDGEVCLRLQHVPMGRIAANAFVAQEYKPRRGSVASPVKIVGARMQPALPVALLAAYPLWRFGRDRWRRWRIRPGHCKNCLYDLTGNITGRCPECGTEFDPQEYGIAIADESHPDRFAMPPPHHRT
ncbi:MAG: hypothetical protein J5J06_17955 [Phycisphaerae bacterium]|nr:hypothetical protein [Phycisphaerae bacterium]